jgi:hypothetical protein
MIIQLTPVNALEQLLSVPLGAELNLQDFKITYRADLYLNQEAIDANLPLASTPQTIQLAPTHQIFQLLAQEIISDLNAKGVFEAELST